MQELRALLAFQNEITGLDLAGDEANFSGELFVEHFKIARDAGWHITAHAGEAAGATSIWQAISKLGAERIGHGVRAPEDPKLLDLMRDRKIGIECNLTSNVQTSTVQEYPSHPLKLFLDHGILATINTDDPGISAINLHYEYEVAAPLAGLTVEMCAQAQSNALETAFLSKEEKNTLLQKKLKN
jgi:adenosine deaminase